MKKLFLLIGLFLVPSFGKAAISDPPVQKIKNWNPALGTPFTSTFTVTSTGSGNLLVVLASINKSHSAGQVGITSITDDKSNTWVAASGSGKDMSDSWSEVWYAKNGTSATTGVTIVYFNNAGGNIGVVHHFYEFSGVDTSSPLDQALGVNTTSAPKTPSFSPGIDGELLIANGRGKAANLTGIGSPWTLGNIDSYVNSTASVYYIPASAGTYQGAFAPTGSQEYLTSGASFKAASTAAPGTNSLFFGMEF